MKVKICGITRLEDALLAVELGAWALGFIFYKKSPRFIEPLKVKEIINELPKEIKKIGVFVNSSLTEMVSIAEVTGITTFQLHGEESPELCNSLPKEVVKAFRPGNIEDLKTMENYKGISTFLIDAKVSGEYGGTGKMANLELAKKAKIYGNIILAGGISSENIINVINEVKPFAVDLSSSVEDAPGIKSHFKMRELFREVRRK